MITQFSMVKYTGDEDTLMYDFNINPKISSAIMSENGYVNAIVNDGSHVTVHYYTDLDGEFPDPGVVILLPISMVETAVI